MKHRLKYGVVPLIVLNLAACGGGGNGNTNADNTAMQTSPLSVTAVTPPNDAVDTARDAPINATFDGDVLTVSVDTESFQLLKNGIPQAGSAQLLDSNRIGFTPDQELDLLSIYQPTITQELYDIDGLPLAEPFLWRFVTRDGNWGTTMSYSTGAVDQPLIISTGETLWAFHLRDNLFSGQTDVFAKRLQADNSWAASDLISNNDGDDNVAGSLSVTALSNGDLLAVWQETAGGTDEIWYNRYDHALDTWGTSARITFNNFDRRRPSIVSNGSDHVFVQFELEDTLSGATDLMVIEYSVADDEWLTEQLVANDLDTVAGEGQPAIAMDSAGNMMATWFADNRVLSCYYNLDTHSWEGVSMIDQASAGETGFGNQIIVDAQDRFTATWSQEDNILGIPFIWSSRFVPNQGWDEAQQIAGSDFGQQPVMRPNKDDNIILIWQQHPAVGNDDLLFSGFNSAENAWTPAELLEQGSATAGQHRLVVDASGNFMAIWKQNRSGTFFNSMGNVLIDPPAIWTRRFDNSDDGEWRPAVAISSLDGAVDKPVMAVKSNGEIMALWMQIVDGEPGIYSRYFD